jgi:hypothetical protein
MLKRILNYKDLQSIQMGYTNTTLGRGRGRFSTIRTDQCGLILGNRESFSSQSPQVNLKRNSLNKQVQHHSSNGTKGFINKSNINQQNALKNKKQM